MDETVQYAFRAEDDWTFLTRDQVKNGGIVGSYEVADAALFDSIRDALDWITEICAKRKKALFDPATLVRVTTRTVVTSL